MDETRFWKLIEAAWPATAQAALLRRLAFSGELEYNAALDTIQAQLLDNLNSALNQLGADELLIFDRILERKLYDIDREDIHSYTDGSDDGFLYCRGFIVSMGQEYYEMVNADPSRAVIDVEFESMCYCSYHIYIQRFGPMALSGISRESGSNRAGWPG